MEKWIFFDVGYTLIDETGMWQKRVAETKQLAAANGRDVSEQEIMDKIMECANAFIPIAPNVAKWLGIDDMAKYSAETEVLYPDAEQTLAKLHKKYKLGVIANQPENLDGRLQKLGILQHFDVVVSSHDCGVVKPDEKIFRLALSRAGVDASNAVMVGDRLDNDVEPSKTIGFTTVWVRQGICAGQKPRSVESTPDYIVDSVKQLLEIDF